MRINIVFICLIMLVFLAGCLVSKEEREAGSYSKKYKKEFENKAKEAFGNEAGLKNVEGEIDVRKDSLWSMDHSYVTGRLTGTIVINGGEYKAVYDPEKGQIYSTVNNEKIEQSLLKLLPLDEGRIESVSMSVDDDIEPYFSKDAVDIKSALLEHAIRFTIKTSENIKVYKDEDYRGLSEICSGPYEPFEIKLLVPSGNAGSQASDDGSGYSEVYISPRIDGGYSVLF